MWLSHWIRAPDSEHFPQSHILQIEIANISSFHFFCLACVELSGAEQTFSISLRCCLTDTHLMVSNVVRLFRNISASGWFLLLSMHNDSFNAFHTPFHIYHRFFFHLFFDKCRKGLYISDVPIHDATRDLVLLSEQFEAGYKLTRNLEVLTDKLQQTYRELESEKQKTDR